MLDFKSMTRRPEFAAFVGMVAVYLAFVWLGWPNFTNGLSTGSWLNFATELGIITMPVALLMIAGHLDLSVGSLLAAGAMTYAILANHFEVSDFLALPAGVLVGVFFGFLNGLIVTRTKLESFIVTLAMNFMLSGIVFGVTRFTTKTVLVSVDVDPDVKRSLGGKSIGGSVIPNLANAFIVWVVLALIVSWILYRSKFGNWIFALGGDETSARAAGVPVDRLTIWLFMGTGFGAGLLGVTQVAIYNSAQTSAGQQYVFFTIIAVVVGGVLLTGGYGSTVGAIFGVLTFSIVVNGIQFTDIDPDWNKLVLGVLLLLAVLSNNTFRKLAMSSGDKKDSSKSTGPAPAEPEVSAMVEEASHV